MTFLSKHTVVSRMRDSESWFALNLLSGNADIVERDVAEGILRGDHPLLPEFIAKGYRIDSPEAETAQFNAALSAFKEERDRDEVQLFFVPRYDCNFGCSYCFQDQYAQDGIVPTREIADAFFDHIRTAFAGRRSYVTLFGGEPLLNGSAYRAFMEYFLDKLNEENLELAVVTNGYNLPDWIESLSRVRIREIQITLDGMQKSHDSRRPLKGGGGTFSQVVAGIDACIAQGFPVNLRMVVDRENVHDLPALARFAIERGWTKAAGFKTQLGRNYELHHCQTGTQALYTRLDMYEDLYRMVQEHPQVLEFHKPLFSISRFLFENGELPRPLFDACSGTKTEWAFDGAGKIYACTATVGKRGEELGTFWPAISLDKTEISCWQQRDITTIEKCTSCPSALACGGGCASVAKNETGSLLAPDCRPVRELLELGIPLYFEHAISS